MASYRQILKATSIFGGVQVVTILVNIIRSKLIAILLGPAGMGINGLLNSTLVLVGNITNFGLSASAVKNVAVAFGESNSDKLAKEVTVLRKLVWFTGVLGSLVIFILAPYLSQWAFGNKNYTISFYIVASSLFFNQISSGQKVLLQGTRQILLLAKSSVWGAILSLITSIPLFYFFRENGIAAAILIGSICSLFLTWVYSRKIEIDGIKIEWKEIIQKSKGMLQLGFFLSLSNLISTGFSYVFRIFISKTGSLADVGYYSAGFAMIGTYVGLLFTAMATDYYPRLASVSENNKLVSHEINQQLEVALLIISPILCAFLFFADWALIFLYSNQFLIIKQMMIWAAFGIYFKSASWSIGYVFLAKGNSRLFFVNELFTHAYLFVLNMTFYHFWGLLGVGVSYCLGYFLHFIQMYKMASLKYDFKLSSVFWRLFFTQIPFGLVGLVLSLTIERNYYFFIIGFAMVVVNTIISIILLDKKVRLIKAIKNKYFKRNQIN